MKIYYNSYSSHYEFLLWTEIKGLKFQTMIADDFIKVILKKDYLQIQIA